MQIIFQLFIKVMRSFVAIELFTLSKNAKFHFFAEESYQYFGKTNDIP